MTRKKNSAAPDTARTAPAPQPSPSAGLVPAGPAAAVQAALTASHGDGATTASIAATAGISRAAASKALTTLETAGLAERTKGGRPGIPDTWHLAAAPASPGAGDQPPAGEGTASSEPAAPPMRPDTSQSCESPGTADQGQAATPGTGSPDPGQDAAGQAQEAGSSASAAGTQTPEPDVRAEITGHATQITAAADAAVTALAAGDLPAALAGMEEISDQAGQARRALKAAIRGRTSAPARPGGLRDLVAAHLQNHPGREFTPHDIGKALHRSSGAVANALDRLVSLGHAELTAEQPRRFRHLGDTGPAATGAGPAEASDPADSANGTPLAGAA